MRAMSTATLTETPVPTLSLADRLNAVLRTQGERTLGLLDRCDSCSQQHAQAEFKFLITQDDGTFAESEVLLCGHHTRAHIAAIMDQNPVSAWIDPSILWKIKGVEVPTQENTKSGDGLTDA